MQKHESHAHAEHTHAEHHLHTPVENNSHVIITYILLAVVIVQGFFNFYLLTGNSLNLTTSTGIDALGVKKAILEFEYDKVWGKENYELVSKATLIQMKEQLPQIKQYIESNGWSTTNAANPANPTPTTEQVMDATQIQKVLSTAAIEGNKNANIVVIEYSDMECPFCVRQYSETKLQESLSKQYGDKVAFAFKNNKWVNHPGTEAKAVAALCAKKVWGSDAYAKFYHAIMDGTTQSTVFPVSSLAEIPKKIWLDAKKWQSCYDAKETAAEFAAETQEANGLGLWGTPGTLILNVKTGKYATVEWAYPYTNFAQKIDSLMN